MKTMFIGVIIVAIIALAVLLALNLFVSLDESGIGSIIPESIRQETYDDALAKWSDDKIECKIMDKSGAPIHEVNQCIFEYTKKALEICDRFPDEPRCDDVRQFVQGNPKYSFLLD